MAAPLQDERRKNGRAPESLRYKRLRSEIEPPLAVSLRQLLFRITAVASAATARAASMLNRLTLLIRS